MKNQDHISYGPHDAEVRDFLSTANSLSADDWLNGVFATLTSQDESAVAAAKAELTQALEKGMSRGLGEGVRAADQYAQAIVEANIPQSAAQDEKMRAFRRGMAETIRGATLAIALRDWLSSEAFRTLYTPFAGVRPSGGDSDVVGEALDPDRLVLAESEVPTGFKLRESQSKPHQASRMFGKARFMRFGDAIWSELTVFDDDETAHLGLSKLVDYHKAAPSYEDVRETTHVVGDESYVHTGTMRGRPGLWAGVRLGRVVHRFNTYGLGEGQSMELLKHQLSKQEVAGV